MIIASARLSLKKAFRPIVILTGFALFASAAISTMAQTDFAQTRHTESMVSLPDAPEFSSGAAPVASEPETRGVSAEADDFVPLAPEHMSLPTRRDMTVLPHESSHPLSSHGKVVLGFRESVSIFSILGWSSSAGYNHLVNGSPNYGTDKAAFGERLGATALRNVSENIFSVSVFAPLLHEDPRYYELGSDHRVVKRVLYGASRSLITKTDSGHSSLNLSLLAGNLLGSALTNAYYPERNRGFGQTMQTFGTSVGGSAFGFVVTEFLNDGLVAAHLRKAE